MKTDSAIDSKPREVQAGFRKDRGSIEQIFALRNITEQCLNCPLYISFIDFKKAFDSLHRGTLWKIWGPSQAGYLDRSRVILLTLQMQCHHRRKPIRVARVVPRELSHATYSSTCSSFSPSTWVCATQQQIDLKESNGRDPLEPAWRLRFCWRPASRVVVQPKNAYRRRL